MTIIIEFSAVQKPETDTADSDGWVVVAGNPITETQILHTNREKNMVSRIW